VSEIEQLLEQCTPEELSSILENLSGGIPLPAAAPPVLSASDFNCTSAAPTQESLQLVPAPPQGPPPSSRPNPRHGKLVQAQPEDTAAPSAVAVAAAGSAGEPLMSMTDLRTVLAHHGEAVLGEVRRLVSASTTAAGVRGVAPMEASGGDVAFLAEVLRRRDDEVGQLEAQLQALQAQLAEKDEHVFNLRGQLDHTIREVRHRQLDLEFIQTKLEERMRVNVEAEAAQRVMASRIEELSLMAKHCAVDSETCAASSGLSVHAQGALPWSVRKQRLLPGLNMAGMQQVVPAPPLTQPSAGSLQ